MKIFLLLLSRGKNKSLVSYRTMKSVELRTVLNHTPVCQITRISSVQNDTPAVSNLPSFRLDNINQLSLVGTRVTPYKRGRKVNSENNETSSRGCSVIPALFNEYHKVQS